MVMMKININYVNPFYGKYLEAREDEEYKKLKKEWQQKYG